MVIAIDQPHSAISRDKTIANARLVQIWLGIVALFIFAMVVVGGATRLTGSGLSITEWQPILGAIPPLSDSAWQEAFTKYQQIPQFRIVNHGMTLSDFKEIYWWEWAHRFLGRSIGLIVLIPFLFLLWRRAIPRGFAGRIALLFVLGAAQGALGWYMVKSGLSERVDVSQYRLAAHLGLAVAIGGYCLWLALSAIWADERRVPAQALRKTGFFRRASVLLAAFIYLQILMGGIVAGLKAGHASDTWPLMQDHIIPPSIGDMSPWYINLTENPMAAQFVHRVIAYIAALAILALGAAVWLKARESKLALPSIALTALVTLQIVLGIATVIYGVPLHLALAHQANAILLFAAAIWLAARARFPGANPASI